LRARSGRQPAPNGQVAELTNLLDLTGWPTGSRVLVRRARAHPGAQLSFADHDGHRFQAILTDQTGDDVAAIERRHRKRAGVEDHIRNDKDTGLRNLPYRDFEHNGVWLALVLIAHRPDLLRTLGMQASEPPDIRAKRRLPPPRSRWASTYKAGAGGWLDGRGAMVMSVRVALRFWFAGVDREWVARLRGLSLS
jgi:hypothetical protein